jgi:hypothetical protein
VVGSGDPGDDVPFGFGLPSPTMVELLYEAEPDPNLDAIVTRAAERAGSPATAIGDGEQRGISFPDHVVPISDLPVPMTVWILSAERTRADDWIETTLHQTWTWREGAAAVVPRATASLLISDMFAGPLERHERLRLFHAGLAAIVEDTHPIAMRWINGERFLDPEFYLRDVDDDPLGFEATINVRFVTFEDQPGVGLMDSVGMAAFALPDVQLHFMFTELEPKWVGRKVYGVARYLFDEGDVIENGHTVPGLSDDDHWPCAHEWAILGPRRLVVDINPGPHGPARRTSGNGGDGEKKPNGLKRLFGRGR